VTDSHLIFVFDELQVDMCDMGSKILKGAFLLLLVEIYRKYLVFTKISQEPFDMKKIDYIISQIIPDKLKNGLNDITQLFLISGECLRGNFPLPNVLNISEFRLKSRKYFPSRSQWLTRETSIITNELE